MIPLKPDREGVVKENLSSQASHLKPGTLQANSYISELASKLILSLESHLSPSKQSVAGKISQNIYQMSDINEIHEDCVWIHELCQEILNNSLPLMKDEQFLKMIDSLSSIERKLELQDNKLEILNEIRNEIKDLQSARDWTQKLSTEPPVSAPHTPNLRETAQTGQSFWKTLLKAMCFSSLISQSEAYLNVEPIVSDKIHELEPLVTTLPVLESHQFSPWTSDNVLAPLIVHVGQTAQQCMETDFAYQPLPSTTLVDTTESRSFKYVKGVVEVQHLDSFISNSSVPIDNQLLLHLVGDIYGEGTQLEGGKTVINLVYLHRIVEQELYYLEQNSACSGVEREQFCRALFEGTEIESGVLFSKPTLENLREQILRAINVGFRLLGEFSEFYNAAISQVNKLAIGDSFFFPIKWPKHALACEIIRDAEDSYAVRIYNTGEGSDLNSKVYTPTGIKQLPFVEVVDVTHKNLQNPAFYNGLWRLAKVQEIENPIETLYYQIMKALKGTSSTRSYSVQEFLAPQKSGTCSMRVLSAVFCQLLGNVQQCHQLNWKFGLKAISDFYQQHQNDLKTNIISRNNLRNGLTAFTALSQELGSKNIVDVDSMHYAAKIVEIISNALDASEDIYEEMQRENRPNCVVTDALPVLPLNRSLAEYQFNWQESNASPPFEFAVPFVSLPNFTPENFIEEIYTITGHLNTLSIRTKTTRPDIFYNYELALQVIDDLPSPSSNFWQMLSLNNVTKAIEKLTDLEFELLRAVNNFAFIESSRKVFTPSDAAVSSMKLIAIMDTLAQRTPAGELAMPNLYQKSFGDICEGRHPLFTGLSPRGGKQLAEIKEYWKKRKPVEADDPKFVSFFGIEATHGRFQLYSDDHKIREDHGRAGRENIYGENMLIFRDWPFQKWTEDYLRSHLKQTEKIKNYLCNLKPDKCKDFDSIKKTTIHILGVDVVDPRNSPWFDLEAFPKNFYTLRDASFAANSFLQGFFGENLSSYFYNRPMWWISEVVGDIYDLYTSYKLINGGSDTQKKYCSTWYGDLYPFPTIPSGLPLTQRLPPSEEVEEIWAYKGLRNRHSPEEIYAKSLPELGLNETTVKKIGIERLRNYLMCSAHRELQISRTLSLFSQEVVKAPDQQWLFEHLIFEPLVLRESLTQDKAQVKLLLVPFTRVINNQYKAIKMGIDDSHAIFTVRLHRRFQQEVEYIYPADPEINQLIPNVREKIINLIKIPSTSERLRKALYQELAISYAHTDTWDDNSLAQFLIAHVAASSSSTDARLLTDTVSNIEQQEAFNIQFQKIAEYSMAKSSYDLILNQVVKASIPGMPKDVAWRPYNAFPIFKGTLEGSDQEYEINLLSGEIRDKTGPLTPLPTSVANYPAVAELRKKYPDAVITSPAPDQWYLTSPIGGQYRMQLKNGKIILQKQIDRNWYQLDEAKKLSIPTLTQDKTHWIYKNQEGDVKMLIEDSASAKPFAYGNFDSKINKFKIYKADDAGKPTSWIFEDVSQPESQLHFLVDIEKPSQILFWRDETTGDPKEIFLPRANLYFRAEKQNDKFVFICDALGGYAIAQKQSVDSLGDAMHYLVLEKGKDKKVLIPRVAYAELGENASSLHPLSKLDNDEQSLRIIKSSGGTTIYSEFLFNFRYFIYGVQNTTQTSAYSKETELIPADQEARFFLSMINLWHHNYEEALEFLVGHGGQQKRYSVEEFEVLKWISRLDRKNKDEMPEANLIRLQARILLMRNERNFGVSSLTSIFADKDFLKESLISYERYLTHPITLGQFGLQQDDEHFFLREILSMHSKESFIDKFEDVFTKNIAETIYENLNQRLSEINARTALKSKASITKQLTEPPSHANFKAGYSTARLDAGHSSFSETGLGPYHRLSFKNPAYSYMSGSVTYDINKQKDLEPSNNILKPLFGKAIPEFFQAVRSRDPDLMRTMLQKITRSDVFNSLDMEKLISALDQVLEFIAKRPLSRDAYEETPSIARLFRNILHHPNVSELPITLTISEENILKKEIEKIFSVTADLDSGYVNNFDVSKFWKFFSPTPPARQLVLMQERPDFDNQFIKETPLLTHELTIPHIPDLVEFYIEPAIANTLMTLNPLASLNATREELANDINIATNNTVANRVIKKLHDEIASYEGPATAQSYAIKDWPAIQNLGKALSQEYTASGTKLATLRQQIETLIQKEPSDTAERASRKLGAAIKHTPLLNIDDAIYLYLRHSPKTFQELNPALNEEDQNTFLSLMQRYLIESTSQQHRSRILKGISDIDEIQKAKGPDAVPQKLKDNLGGALFSQRAYEPVEHPEYLVLEHFMDILLWDKQVEALNTLLIKDGKITAPENLGSAIELIMGSGKTDVLLPLICLLNADGTKLAIGIVPRVLLAENAAELSQRVGPAFRQVLDVVRIDQDTRLDLKELINLHDNLKYAIKDRRIVMMSDSDVQGLVLRFDNACIDAKELRGSELYEKLLEIAEFRKIFRLFREIGAPIFDEADTAFNARLSQHQTKGDPQPLPEAFTEGTKAFMLALGDQALSAASFETPEEIADHIAGVAIQPQRGTPFEKNGLLATYLSRLKPGERKIISAFLQGSNEPAVLRFIDDIPQKFDANSLEKAEMIQDVLSILREQISTLASLIFSKKYRFDFAPPVSEEALDHVEKVENLFSIPHKKGNPSIGSKPGTELEEILYTYRQFLLRQRLPATFFKNAVEDIRKKVISESSKHKRMEDIPAYKELLLLFGDKLPSLNQPFENVIIEEALAALATDSKNLINFIDKHIIKEILFYPFQLNSNAQFYRFLFKNGWETAFSGTIWNGESWPGFFSDDLHLSDTAQKTLILMYQGAEKTLHVINIADATTAKDAVAAIFTKNPESTSIIEGAGDLLKFDYKEVAISMLSHSNLSKKQAVRYPDKETGLWMEIERGKTEPSLVEQSKLSPSQVAVYWPAPKTTGSDVATAPDEVATVVFGRNTILRDVQQTLWRLRGFDKGQGARYAVDIGDGAIIRQNLGQATGHPITGELQLKHAVQNAAYMQAMQVGDDNARTFKSRLDAAMMHRVWNMVLDPAISDQGVVDIMHTAKPLYLSKTIERPYHMYGKPKTLRPREKVAGEWFNTALKNPALSVFQPAERESVIKEMQEIHQKAMPQLPSELLAAQQYGFEREVQKEVLKETHKETRKETQTQTQTDVDTQRDFMEPIPRDWQVNLFPWKDEGLFTSAYFSNLLNSNHLSTTDYLFNLVSGKDLFELNSQPIVPLSLFISASAEQGDFYPDYSPNLHSSLNLSPIHKFPHSLAKPYSRIQEYPRIFVVIQTSSGTQSMLINENEEKRFKELLRNDRINKAPGNRELKVALYDLATGVAAQSSDPIDFAVLEHNPEFIIQKVQLKFYSGMSDFTEEEEPMLREWIQSCGPEKMKRYFETVVLKNERKDSRLSYMHSALENVFKELINP